MFFFYLICIYDNWRHQVMVIFDFLNLNRILNSSRQMVPLAVKALIRNYIDH